MCKLAKTTVCKFSIIDLLKLVILKNINTDESAAAVQICKGKM